MNALIHLNIVSFMGTSDLTLLCALNQPLNFKGLGQRRQSSFWCVGTWHSCSIFTLSYRR